MINSRSRKLSQVLIPPYNGEIKMLPFDLHDIAAVPLEYQHLVRNMINHLPVLSGTAWLTIDGKTLVPGNSHRRGGAHIDGNYIPNLCGWGSGGSGGGNGWKVGEGGQALNSETHKISYENKFGGMLITSDHPGCKGWAGSYRGKAGIGGDCSHIELGDGFILEPNHVYYGNSQFIHESLPIMEEVHRTLVRITLPLDYAPIR